MRMELEAMLVGHVLGEVQEGEGGAGGAGGYVLASGQHILKCSEKLEHNHGH